MGEAMLKTAALVIAALLLAGGCAQASQKMLRTAQDLSDACKSTDKEILLTCDTYIQGIRDWMMLNGLAYNEPSLPASDREAIEPYSACGAPGATDIRRLFIRWLARSPNYRMRPAAMGVWIVISANWPCLGKGGPQLPHTQRPMHKPN